MAEELNKEAVSRRQDRQALESAKEWSKAEGDCVEVQAFSKEGLILKPLTTLLAM